MSDKTLTELTAITTIVGGDKFYVVNSSDTTDSASGSSRQITYSNFVAGILTEQGITASVAELNTLDGITASVAELNYVDGVTSAIQTQINLKAPLASPTFTGTVVLPTSQIITSAVLNTGVSGTAKATATEVATGIEDAKFTTPLAVAPYANNSMYRQAIINGNFDVWQRGTSIAMTTANAYTPDRWYAETATAATDKTITRQDGTGVNGSYYSARVAMVQDTDELLTFSQALESQDSIKFRGGKVTLSFYAKGGAEFVADNATLVSKIVTGKGSDQKVLAFTTSADAISQNNTLTTSWVKFTCTTTNVIAADITQIGVSFSFTHAGSGTTTNYFEVTQVQLCAGSVALPFMPKSYEEELRACQRYCYGISVEDSKQEIAYGSCNTTTQFIAGVALHTRMRTLPTLTVTANEWSVLHANTETGFTAVAIVNDSDNSDFISLNCTVASGLTAGNAGALRCGSSGKTMIFSAEL